MNQILQVKDTKKLKPIDSKKVLVILIIIIAILALCIGGYFIYQNLNNGNIKLPIFTQVPERTAIITLTQTDRNGLIVHIESETGISNISYLLNDKEIQTIKVSGELVFEETISDIPVGENAIFVSVIDIEGKETTKQENFVVEAPKPVIELSVVGNDIKITVTSEIELAEITYKWNADNEKKENMTTYEDKFNFEKQLNIPVGQNTLIITATDVDGGKTDKIQQIKGVTKATTTTRVEGEYLHFTVTGKENIEKVEFIFNGQKYLMNTDTFGETKKVHYKVKLIEGTNLLTVTSTTRSGGIETVSYEQEYTTK